MPQRDRLVGEAEGDLAARALAAAPGGDRKAAGGALNGGDVDLVQPHMLLQEQPERGGAQGIARAGVQPPVDDHHRVAIGDDQQARRALVLEAGLAWPVQVELAFAGLSSRVGLDEAALGLGHAIEVGGGAFHQSLIVGRQGLGEGRCGDGCGKKGRGQEFTSAHQHAFSGRPLRQM